MLTIKSNVIIDWPRRLPTIFHTILLRLLIMLISVPVFWYMVEHQSCWADVTRHVESIQDGIYQGGWRPIYRGEYRPHFLFHITVLAVARLAGFSNSYRALGFVTVLILTLSVAAKACITNYFLLPAKLNSSTLSLAKKLAISRTTLVALISFGLTIMMPIVLNPYRIYLGQISPTVWHSPTTIFAMPLGILLFYYGYRLLDEPCFNWAVCVAFIAVVNVIAKPNFFMAFVPIFLLLGFYQYRLSRSSGIVVLSMIPAIVILTLQYLSRYGGAGESTMVLAPFLVWRKYSPFIPLSLLVSLAFPLAYLGLYRNALVHKGMLVFVWGVFLSSLAWAVLFAEAGPRLYDGNFFWGTHVSIYILMLVTTLDFLSVREPASVTYRAVNRRGNRYTIVWLILVAHFASGVAYLMKIGLLHSCY